jgi:TfoX/Sxy family transcriptional regulator of competence genes
MSTTIDFIEYVISLIEPRFYPRYKKMFGEYMIYINNKPLILVCDSMVYVKDIPQLSILLDTCEKGAPYPKAKLHYIIDFENKDLFNEVIQILDSNTILSKK